MLFLPIQAHCVLSQRFIRSGPNLGMFNDFFFLRTIDENYYYEFHFLYIQSIRNTTTHSLIFMDVQINSRTYKKFIASTYCFSTEMHQSLWTPKLFLSLGCCRRSPPWLTNQLGILCSKIRNQKNSKHNLKIKIST